MRVCENEGARIDRSMLVIARARELGVFPIRFCVAVAHTRPILLTRPPMPCAGLRPGSHQTCAARLIAPRVRTNALAGAVVAKAPTFSPRIGTGRLPAARACMLALPSVARPMRADLVARAAHAHAHTACPVGPARACAVMHSSAHSQSARVRTGAARSGPNEAVVLCAAFALGNASSSTCPASYVPLTNEDACASAAAIANSKYGDPGAYSYYPAGCYWHRVTGTVYYNTDATGAANYYAQPLCAGAAPVPQDARVHVG